LALFARQAGRQQDGLNSLGLVAALMALANPNTLLDVGLQLSFMANLSLVLYATPLTETLVLLAGPVGEYILQTFAALITTLPVIAYHFNRISLLAFPVNPLILPAQPPVMILGGLALLAGASAKRLAFIPGILPRSPPGQVLDLGQGARLEMLAASRSGAVLLLEWRKFRALLPIGLDKDLCQSLLEDPGPMLVTALLLTSSGEADLNPPEWLQAWEPQLALLSVAAGDRRARGAASHARPYPAAQRSKWLGGGGEQVEKRARNLPYLLWKSYGEIPN
jgi:predicted membrane metal-binding protein